MKIGIEYQRLNVLVPKALRIRVREWAARRDCTIQREIVDRLSRAYGIVINEDGTVESSEAGEEVGV